MLVAGFFLVGDFSQHKEFVKETNPAAKEYTLCVKIQETIGNALYGSEPFEQPVCAQ